MMSPSASSMKLSYVPDSSPGAVIEQRSVRQVRGRAELMSERLGVIPVGDVVRLGTQQCVKVGKRQALDRIVDRVMTAMPS